MLRLTPDALPQFFSFHVLVFSPNMGSDLSEPLSTCPDSGSSGSFTFQAVPDVSSS